MRFMYDPETRSFTMIDNQEEQEAQSLYDWSKINASNNGSGIYHYTDVKGYYGIMKSGFVAVSNGGAEYYGSRKPVVWLTKSDFRTSSIARRANTDLYTVGFSTNGFECCSMIGHCFGCKIEIPHTVYIPIRFEVCSDATSDGSIRLISWAEYKATGYINKEIADAAESGNKLAKADPRNTFILSCEDIPVYCFVEPKVMKGCEWVSIRELDDIINCLPDCYFIDARIRRNGQWVPVADIPND